MKITIQQAKGATLIARADSNHWVVMDSVKQFGGQEAATKPMEMLLMSLGGCTSMDVLSLAEKMRTAPSDYEVIITAERADEHPKVFTKIHLSYRFFGENLDEEKLNKAVKLSKDKYCSVSAMLSKSVPITYDIILNPESE